MQGTNSPPAQILKEILLRLAARRLPPTPLNFTQVHNEISGSTDNEIIIAQDFLRLIDSEGDAGGAPAENAGHAEDSPRGTALRRMRQAKERERALLALLEMTFEQALLPFLAQRPDLGRDFREILTDFAAQTDASAQSLRLARPWAQRAGTYAAAHQEIEAGVKNLLHSLCMGLAPLAEDVEMSHGQIETITQIATLTPLTAASLRDAEQALLGLARIQTRSRDTLRVKKKELQEIVLEVMRQFSRDAAEIGAKSDRIASITEEVLDNDDNAFVRQSLMTLVSETQDLSRKMKQAQRELAEREAEIVQSNHEIESLRLQLISVSQKVKEDSLTGVMNRRGLTEAANREISLAERKQQRLCLALLDIDDFKAFNDLLGHDGGDEALKYLADTLSGVLRPSDSITRFGGEEFVVLLPHTTEQDAKKVLQRVQRALTKDLWLNQHQRLLTFSSGVTAWREHDTLSLMISRADHLMYCAKRQGKNRVISDGDESNDTPSP